MVFLTKCTLLYYVCFIPTCTTNTDGSYRNLKTLSSEQFKFVMSKASRKIDIM